MRKQTKLACHGNQYCARRSQTENAETRCKLARHGNRDCVRRLQTKTQTRCEPACHTYRYRRLPSWCDSCRTLRDVQRESGSGQCFGIFVLQIFSQINGMSDLSRVGALTALLLDLIPLTYPLRNSVELQVLSSSSENKHADVQPFWTLLRIHTPVKPDGNYWLR